MKFILALAAALNAIPGTVILAKVSAAQASFVWDATPRVVQLTATPITPAHGQRAIQIDALQLLRSRAESLKAERVTLRVIYVLSRLSASYGDPTLADRGPLVELSAKRADVIRNASAWRDALAAGHKPNGLTVTVLGEFPTTY